MIHLLVRGDVNEVDKLLQIFNDNLKHDVFEIVEKTRISNKPIFSGHATITELSTTKANSKLLERKFNAEYVTQQTTLMELLWKGK